MHAPKANFESHFPIHKENIELILMMIEEIFLEQKFVFPKFSFQLKNKQL